MLSIKGLVDSGLSVRLVNIGDVAVGDKARFLKGLFDLRFKDC